MIIPGFDGNNDKTEIQKTMKSLGAIVPSFTSGNDMIEFQKSVQDWNLRNKKNVPIPSLNSNNNVAEIQKTIEAMQK